jgi:type I restriction enzyme R subunit
MVLDAMTDHEKLSMEVLGDEQTQRGFALLILRMLAGSKTVSQEPPPYS